MVLLCAHSRLVSSTLLPILNWLSVILYIMKTNGWTVVRTACWFRLKETTIGLPPYLNCQQHCNNNWTLWVNHNSWQRHSVWQNRRYTRKLFNIYYFPFWFTHGNYTYTNCHSFEFGFNCIVEPQWIIAPGVQVYADDRTQVDHIFCNVI